MKRLFISTTVLLVLFIAHVPVFAQEGSPSQLVPRWTPDKGYWVAENSPVQPQLYTLYFYNDEHVLVYKERIEGMRLRLDSRRVKMRLKKVLQTSLLAWEQQRPAKENEGLVINLLRRK